MNFKIGSVRSGSILEELKPPGPGSGLKELGPAHLGLSYNGVRKK
jgi:hypothetical protein